MLKLTVIVTPNAKRQRVELDAAGRVRIFLTAQPERGKANRALIALLARKLGVSRSAIVVQKGLTSRYKLLFIAGELTMSQALQLLGLPYQQGLPSIK